MVIILSLVSMLWGYGAVYVIMVAVAALYVIAAYKRPITRG